ncbi:MAG: hypothetical protein HZA66_06715 [Rhodopseudomonas palustris]|uniref:Uncharacterized protein n=1 Tax=Rhodopseudomonas palustris TaxID=1076 RepID=A0A933RV00_RHOPL|nr:hypothetical protein [Rhodopseudomonas palustris]
MTDQKRAAIRELIERQTLLKTASKEVAREFLVREGIYTEDGNLSPRFGGVDRGAPRNNPDNSKRA